MASNVSGGKRALPDNDRITRTSSAAVSAAASAGKDGNSQNVGPKKNSSNDQRALTDAVEARNDKAAQPSVSKAKKPKKKATEKLDVDALNKRWAERFNRLEAMFLAQKVVQPSFRPMSAPVSPNRAPVVVSDKPFFPPVGGRQAASEASNSAATGSSSLFEEGEIATQNPPASVQPVVSAAGNVQGNVIEGNDIPPDSVDNGDNLDNVSEFSDPGDTAELLSEEQTYRETVRGVRSFMGWTQVPDFDSPSAKQDNPFAGLRQPAPSKVSVKLPPDDWLCQKMDHLNITM